jgi:hypothetical protein
MASEYTLFFKIEPTKLALRDNFSWQQILDNFLSIFYMLVKSDILYRVINKD